MATGRPFDLPYSVELWDDADCHVEELIALTGDYRVARAASDEPGKASAWSDWRIAGESIRAPTEADALWRFGTANLWTALMLTPALRK
jgi:hypothetical protein